jgi:hypothetical protein
MKTLLLILLLSYSITKNLAASTTTCISDNCACIDQATVSTNTSTCPNDTARDCHSKAKCELNADNKCAYSNDKHLQNCLDNAMACVRSGCSGENCVEKENTVILNCFRYDEALGACYQSAECGKKGNKCGWTESQELKDCLSKLA